MKLQLTLLIFTLTLFNCSSDNKDDVLATAHINLTFTHKWGNALVTNEDFNNIQFINGDLFLNNNQIFKSRVPKNDIIYCGNQTIDVIKFEEKLELILL